MNRFVTTFIQAVGAVVVTGLFLLITNIQFVSMLSFTNGGNIALVVLFGCWFAAFLLNDPNFPGYHNVRGNVQKSALLSLFGLFGCVFSCMVVRDLSQAPETFRFDAYCFGVCNFLFALMLCLLWFSRPAIFFNRKSRANRDLSEMLVLPLILATSYLSCTFIGGIETYTVWWWVTILVTTPSVGLTLYTRPAYAGWLPRTSIWVTTSCVGILGGIGIPVISRLSVTEPIRFIVLAYFIAIVMVTLPLLLSSQPLESR